MKKQFWLILILASCLVVGLWLASINLSPSVQVQAQRYQEGSSEANEVNGFDRINKKARAAKTGGSAEARELADAVVDPYTTGNPLIESDSTMSEVKERLARAEVDYRQGRSKGIPEDNVVRLVNALGGKFGAPEYAKTDRSEVRGHRMALFLLTPHLTTIDRPEKGERGKGGKGSLGGLSPKMSPLEAANVTMSLVYQKIFNQDYQKDASEREASRRARRASANGDNRAQLETANKVSPRAREMVSTAIRGSFSLLASEERNRFAHRSLDILGIPR